MDCDRKRQLDITRHKKFAPSHRHTNRSLMLRTSYVMETSSEMPKERRQLHECI